MSKSIVIECREKSSGTTDRLINGVWNTTLPQGIKIEKNDIIQFKSAFIDSVAKSQDKIVLTGDNGTNTMAVSIEAVLYHYNYESN